MRIAARSRTFAVAITAGFLAACGGSQAQYPGGEDNAVIVVDNTRTTHGSLSVDLVPETGVKQRLGNVTHREEKSFRVDNIRWGDQFRLVAENAAGDELVSRPFSLSRGTVVTWDLNLNTVSFGRQAEASPLIKL